MTRATLVFAAALIAAGCGGATAEMGTVEETSLTENEASHDEAAPATCTEESYSIPRADLDEILAAGPANLLASVQTDSHMADGKFAGFRIVSFRVDVHPCLDLREEDVITTVNGESIERPEHYFAVFEKLSTATEVRFDLIRDGKATTITYPVN